MAEVNLKRRYSGSGCGSSGSDKGSGVSGIRRSVDGVVEGGQVALLRQQPLQHPICAKDVEKLFKGYGRIRDVVIKVRNVPGDCMIIYRDLPLSAEREWNLRVLQVRG